MSRIKTIVDLIDPVNTIIDIGTDHGKVLIEAFKQNKIKKAIATDINQGPLNSAIKAIEKHNLEKKTSFYKTDGFLGIDEPFDAVVITGMGYNTIINILSVPHQEPKYYILGAQRQLKDLRIFLTNNNYKIIDEVIYYGKKEYVFLKAIKEKQKLSIEQIILGPILKRNKHSLKYYKKRVKSLKTIYKKTTKENRDNLLFEIETIQSTIAKLLK